MKYTIPKIFMGRPLEEWLRDEKKDLENRVKNPTTSDKSSLDDFILYAGTVSYTHLTLPTIYSV